MSKISEQKALEAYPMDEYEFDKAKKSDIERKRFAYIKGYNQAIQDFLEKACKWLKENSERYVMFDEVGYRCYAYNLLTKDFKNYIENESET